MEKEFSAIQRERAAQKSKLEELVRQKNKRRSRPVDDEEEYIDDYGVNSMNVQRTKKPHGPSGNSANPPKSLPFDDSFGTFFGPSKIIVSEAYKQKIREEQEVARRPPETHRPVHKVTYRKAGSQQTRKNVVTQSHKPAKVAKPVITAQELSKLRDFSDIFGDDDDDKPTVKPPPKQSSVREQSSQPKSQQNPQRIPPSKALPKPPVRPSSQHNQPPSRRFPNGALGKKPIPSSAGAKPREASQQAAQKPGAPLSSKPAPQRRPPVQNVPSRPRPAETKNPGVPARIQGRQVPSKGGASGQRQPQPKGVPKRPMRRQQSEDEYSNDSFLEDEEGGGRPDLSSVLSMFRRNHRENHLQDMDDDFDDRAMEAGWEDVRKEESRSARIARMEDEREQALEEERERRLLEKKKKKKSQSS